MAACRLSSAGNRSAISWEAISASACDWARPERSSRMARRWRVGERRQAGPSGERRAVGFTWHCAMSMRRKQPRYTALHGLLFVTSNTRTVCRYRKYCLVRSSTIVALHKNVMNEATSFFYIHILNKGMSGLLSCTKCTVCTKCCTKYLCR